MSAAASDGGAGTPAGPTPASIIRTYLTITGLLNGALALIWGVNTLFLLGAGLDIFQVMLVNAAFSFGQFVFEIPTGVVADTVGRRVSLLLCLVTLFGSTLAYVGMAWLHMGVLAFTVVSVLLGLGFTFYTGALDAWMVDALKHLGHSEPLDRVFARSQMVFGVAMLCGTTLGGLLGQVHLYYPYLLRAALIVPTFVVAWAGMKELGWAPPRALSTRTLPAEMKKVFVVGLRFGMTHRVVRPLMLASAVASTFAMFGFYSWQRYFLDLLHQELVWVTGVIAALVGFAGVVGNLLLPRLSRVIKTRTGVLMFSVAVKATVIVLAGLLTNFYFVVGLYLVGNVTMGLANPVKQALLNAHIPSEQRATIISLDSLVAELGSGVGQTGWGYVARRTSIADAWVRAGAFILLGLPLLYMARRGCSKADRFEPVPTAAGQAR